MPEEFAARPLTTKHAFCYLRVETNVRSKKEAPGCGSRFSTRGLAVLIVPARSCTAKAASAARCAASRAVRQGGAMDLLTIVIQVWLILSAVLMWGLWGPWGDS